jgi:hypothetical protein
MDSHCTADQANKGRGMSEGDIRLGFREIGTRYGT